MIRFLNKIVVLLIILAIAIFFRLWQLDKIPPGLYPDVAMNGNDALDSLKSGNFKVFYPDNFGREGLFIWLIALSFSIFGVSIWSIKIVAAIIGVLTVFGLYLLTKEVFGNLTMKQFNNEIVALLASFFLAISFWHTNFSRIGFRAILLPFILVFAFYFIFKGFRTKKFWHFVIAGIFFGLGFYTYTSYRFIVLLLPLVLFFWWRMDQKQNLKKQYLLLVISHLSLVILIALPIGFYFLRHPQDFLGRATPISIFATENPIKELGKSLILHLGMFNFYGDPNWRHNFSGSPMLFWPIGILFLIGLAFSLKELINFRKHKNFSFVIESPKETRGERKTEFSLIVSHLSLVAWFIIMLLPGILTYEGVPHSLRVIGVIPVVHIFAGLGGYLVYDLLSKNTKRKILLFLAILLFLIAMGVSEFNKYFVLWAKNPRVEEAFTKRYSDIGDFLNSLPQNIQKYVIVNEPGAPLYGISIPAQTPIFIERAKYGKPRAVYLRFEDFDQIQVNGQKTIIIPLYDGKIFAELFKKFPGGKIKTEKGFQFYELF